MAFRICDIAECGNKLSEHSRLPTCQTCRGSFYYWRKRKPADIFRRRLKLIKYGDRMDTLLDRDQALKVKVAKLKHRGKRNVSRTQQSPVPAVPDATAA